MDSATPVLPELAYAFGGPPVRGRLRELPEDFQVCELPLVEPDGSGEHVWLWIRKRNENTDHVAGLLSRLAGVHPRNISYAGLKDRNAVTEQWFSVHLPGKPEPDWSQLDSDTVRVLRHVRHGRKLQRGTLRGNTFRITVRGVDGNFVALECMLDRVRTAGVPNYFGPQRFGVNHSNLQTAAQLFRNPRMKLSRNRHSMALSAARSLLFNAVLSRRVAEDNWNALLAGDALQLAGSHSFFIAESVDDALQARITSHDVHPTGPLCGKGDSPLLGASRTLEDGVLAGYAAFHSGLAAAGLRHERRALRLTVADLQWQRESPGVLVLEFSLPSGCYATSVLRELVED